MCYRVSEHICQYVCCSVSEHICQYVCCRVSEHICQYVCCSVSEHICRYVCCRVSERICQYVCCRVSEHICQYVCCRVSEHICQYVCCRVSEHICQYVCCRVSEQRRKRVQELGGQITDMKRKILEQGKMLKVKELSVKQCEKLNQEIQVCVSAVVMLVPSAFSMFLQCFLEIRIADIRLISSHLSINLSYFLLCLSVSVTSLTCLSVTCLSVSHPSGDEAAASETDEADDGRLRQLQTLETDQGEGSGPAEGQGQHTCSLNTSL